MTNLYSFSPPRSQGKSLVTMKVVEFAIATGKSFCISTARPDYWYDLIKKEYPHVVLHKDNWAVYINEKVKK